MPYMFLRRAFVLAATTLIVFGCKSDEELLLGEPQFEVRHDEATGRLTVVVHPQLIPGATLHVRVRQGAPGHLNCAAMLGELEQIDGNPVAGSGVGSSFAGPAVDASKYQPFYDETWLREDPPSEAQIQGALTAQHTIDICLMQNGQVVRGAEVDIFRALDRGGTGKFDNYGEDQRIESVAAYARACVAEMGDIPFFEKIGEDDWGTYSCLDSTPIPMVVTDENGHSTFPQESVDKCDNPQFIYNSCEPNAVNGQTNGPRVASRANDQGTHWVLLCRKAKSEEGEYNDVAMIGHNPYTGKTCYFQNALYNRTDGVHVPHPADEKDSPASPQQSNSLWSGIQGGYGSGIQCVDCHDADPFIHSPWIDGAKDANGDPIIPKMGITDGFAQGFNESPYTLVDLEGQGWTMPKHITSPEAAACTKCHRMGDGRWTDRWNDRLEAKDTLWDNLLTPWGKRFEHYFWMPPETEGLDEATWAESEQGKAMAFIKKCGADPNAEGCRWEELPTEQLTDVGELPPIELEGEDLAKEALKILGARITDANDPRCTGEGGLCTTRRCAECHSVSKNGLKHWLDLTEKSGTDCGLNADIDAMTQEDARKAVACLRALPEDPNSVFAADKVGILTTGARHGFFRKLFQKAFEDQDWLKQYISFKQRVSMPKGTYTQISQFEHAVLLKWFGEKLPHLDLIEDPPAPTTCTPFLDKEAIANHTDGMEFDGWGAVNKENGITMYGCDADGANCFANAEDFTEKWGTEVGGNLKNVTKLGFKTSFWTRSSADGRFIGNGGDMVRGVDIKIKASYDPGFFPDNSGFIFQGGGTGICTQSLLETEDEIDFEEEGCIRGTNINLYQHVARGLDGDYFVINSQFTSDSGRTTKDDPKANFNFDSTMKFSPMIFNGQVYEQLDAVIVESPFEGDSVLSPSGQLVISRIGGADGKTLGYNIRRVEAEKSGDNYKIYIDQPSPKGEAKLLATVCQSGAKANISFDERFVVTHHYESDGTSNIYFIDLLDGEWVPITKMPEGSNALFPHFRSDGWFYFLVRQGDDEWVVGGDLAVLRSKG